MAKVTPQVPGETPNTEEKQAGEELNTGASDEMVSVPKGTLEKLLARVDALESSAAASRVQRKANPEENLPDQDSVDRGKIKKPVLTKQGWVLPEKLAPKPAGSNL